jgi:hypothetical protein
VFAEAATIIVQIEGFRSEVAVIVNFVQICFLLKSIIVKVIEFVQIFRPRHLMVAIVEVNQK